MASLSELRFGAMCGGQVSYVPKSSKPIAGISDVEFRQMHRSPQMPDRSSVRRRETKIGRKGAQLD